MDSVAACIPLHEVSNMPAILSFFHHVHAYAAVFGEHGRAKLRQEGPLIDRLNCVLTSVGTKHLSDDWIVDAAEAAEMNADSLDKISYGNISGVFLPRPGINRRQKEAVEGINARGTGIKKSHLKQCAARDPGVVVLAIGRGKAEITRETVRQKLVSRLYVDHELKDALLDLP